MQKALCNCITVDLVILACLNFREFVIWEFIRSFGHDILTFNMATTGEIVILKLN